MQFYYFPLEQYEERYTSLMSKKEGWMEDLFKRNGINDAIRIEGNPLYDKKVIVKGDVLDFAQRSYYSLTQCADFIALLHADAVLPNSILYFEDFWTPGMEAIMYTAQLKGLPLNIYAMLHAQTVDKFDFTYKLKNWMRHYEIGQSKFMKGVFVTSEYLLDLCVEAGLENVYYGGLPFNSQYLLHNFPFTKKKEEQVIYTSRFDAEKNPHVFIELAKRLKHKYKFVMTTSSPSLKGNDPYLLEEIERAHVNGIIELKVGLTKKEYYEELQKSRYQVNCASQDWLSWTMLEAILYRCIPIYPRYRSFPEFLPSTYLYDKYSLDDLIETVERNKEFDRVLHNIVMYFDNSFARYMRYMQYE